MPPGRGFHEVLRAYLATKLPLLHLFWLLFHLFYVIVTLLQERVGLINQFLLLSLCFGHRDIPKMACIVQAVFFLWSFILYATVFVHVHVCVCMYVFRTCCILRDPILQIVVDSLLSENIQMSLPCMCVSMHTSFQHCLQDRLISDFFLRVKGD